MATTLLAPGTAEAVSSPVTLAAGETATIFLTTSTGEFVPLIVPISVQFQRADNSWSTAYQMEGPHRLTARFDGPVVFRVFRPATDAWQPGTGVERA